MLAVTEASGYPREEGNRHSRSSCAAVGSPAGTRQHHYDAGLMSVRFQSLENCSAHCLRAASMPAFSNRMPSRDRVRATKPSLRR